MRTCISCTAAALGLGLLVGLGAGGCRPPSVRPPDLQTLPSPNDALARLRAGAEGRRSMRALSRLTYFGEKGRVRLRTVFVAERPDRFRVETLSPLEQPIDVMASDGARIWLLSKGRFHEGPATPENLSRLLPVPLRPAELVDALLGGIPTTDRFTPTKIAWADEDRERWRLTMVGPGDEVAELRVDPVRRVVERVTMRGPGGAVRLEVGFDDFGAPDRFPHKIELSIPGRADEVTIKLKELEVNVGIAPQIFRLEPPAGVVPEPLDSPPVLVPAE